MRNDSVYFADALWVESILKHHKFICKVGVHVDFLDEFA